MSILRLDNVRKTYQDHVAVNNVSFEVPKGSIFGLLGPNGAGKTSLIRIITTITRADSGVVYLDGEQLNSKHPEQIGYMPEERGLYKKMKVGEQLIYLGQLKGLSTKDAKRELKMWFDKFEINDWWDKKVQELSKGMQQKIQFITTVLHKPKLLILDEPFSGLDPINTNLIKSEIDELHRNGTSIIFSTHRMEQVEEICQHIVLINQGKNVLQGEMKQVKQDYKENQFQLDFKGNASAVVNHNSNLYQVMEHTDNKLIVTLPEESATNQFLSHCIRNDLQVVSFNEILPTLNDIFIKQVGETKE